MSDVRTKSLGYLRDGDVTIRAAAPGYVKASVRGHNGTYVVRLGDHRWVCSCKSVLDDGRECAHVAAVQLVTGYPSAASKPVRVAS